MIPTCARSCARCSRAMDIAVIEAESGQEAIQRLRIRRPALVLLDVMMPAMDGFAAVHAIKREPGPFVPVILLTALDDPASRAKGINAGADEILAKPVHPFELRLRCRAMLRIHQLDRGAARGQPAAARAGAHRRAHRRAQPARAALGADARVPPRRALRRRADGDGVRRRSLQAGQRRSTATPSATACCTRWRKRSSAACARSTWSAASAARSSWCWRRRRRRATRSWWPSACAARWRARGDDATRRRGARDGELRRRHACRTCTRARPRSCSATPTRRSIAPRRSAAIAPRWPSSCSTSTGASCPRAGADHRQDAGNAAVVGDARDYSADFSTLRSCETLMSVRSATSTNFEVGRGRLDVGDDQDAAQVLVVDALVARRRLAADRAVVQRRALLQVDRRAVARGDEDARRWSAPARTPSCRPPACRPLSRRATARRARRRAPAPSTRSCRRAFRHRAGTPSMT